MEQSGFEPSAPTSPFHRKIVREFGEEFALRLKQQRWRDNHRRIIRQLSFLSLGVPFAVIHSREDRDRTQSNLIGGSRLLAFFEGPPSPSVLARYPLMKAQVIGAIHCQALRPWLEGVLIKLASREAGVRSSDRPTGQLVTPVAGRQDQFGSVAR